jgi:hypothetical protein
MLMLAATRTPIGLATALFATAMTIAAAPADAARLALVIGNDNYQYATSFQTARADAQAVARTLERAKFGPSSGKPGAVRSRCAGAIPGGPPSGTFSRHDLASTTWYGADAEFWWLAVNCANGETRDTPSFAASRSGEIIGMIAGTPWIHPAQGTPAANALVLLCERQ